MESFMGMRIKLTDFENYINKHDTKYVEDIHIFEGSDQTPSKGGLLSSEIFGDTTDERRKTMGATKLDGFYLHPLIYSRVIKRSYRKIDELISGETFFKINDDGKLEEIEDEEEGQTGLKFLYENYDNLSIENLEVKEDDSIIMKQLKSVINETDKHEVFTDKWLVIPLMFRDINEAEGGHVSLDEINEMYKKILSLVSIAEENEDNPLFDQDSIRFKIQLELTKIFDHLLDKGLKGKDSVIKKQVMSKKIDYTSRLVMSAPSFKQETFGESPINIDTCGLPLSSCADMFAPYVINNMETILKNKYDRGEIDCTLEEFEDKFNHQELHELIDKYVESWQERVDIITVPGTEDEPIMMNVEKYEDGEWIENEWEMTLTDLIYQATHLAVETNEKYNILSRYPINKVAS